MAKQKRKMTRAQAAKLRKKQRRRKIILLVAEVVVLIVLLAALFVISKYDKIQQMVFQDGDIQSNVKQEGYTTVALFGGDSRQGGLEEGTHSDCIIIAAVDHESKKVRMVSVYRDTLLDQTDGALKKANNAYFVGGPKQAINMLNLNLDLDIEDYVTVDFKALADAIDLLGGIEIDIQPEEIQYINKFMDETASLTDNSAHYIQDSGPQLLNGVQATTYARIRSTAGGDFTRTERQRLVIEKMVEKAKQSDIGTLNKVIDEVFPQVSTSFSLTDALSLAKSMLSYEMDGSEGFPSANQPARLSGSARGDVIVPVDLEYNVEELHDFLFPGESYSPSEKVKEISANIVNETGFVREEPEEDTDSGEEGSGQ